MLLSAKQYEKTYFESCVMLFERVTFASFSHSVKAYTPMLVTLSGTIIVWRFEQ